MPKSPLSSDTQAGSGWTKLAAPGGGKSSRGLQMPLSFGAQSLSLLGSWNLSIRLQGVEQEDSFLGSKRNLMALNPLIHYVEGTSHRTWHIVYLPCHLHGQSAEQRTSPWFLVLLASVFGPRLLKLLEAYSKIFGVGSPSSLHTGLFFL